MPSSESSPFIEDLSRTRIKNCESCGGEFLCHSARCWCEAIKLEYAETQRLRAAYKDCLCPDCLR
jgi:hypothetical protein